ncbi:MAG: hypothetical protein ABI317_08470 [Gaiellales bacterium]
MKGPRITVTCECGHQTKAHYDTRFTCEGCGRVYDTSRIPKDDYEQLASVMRRFKIAGWAFGVVLALIALWLVTQGQEIVLIIGMMSILFIWWSYGRPYVRGRYYRALATLPKWDLKAEPSETAG